MTNALHATMTLRSLHKDDRDWILSKLSSTEKEAIRDVANHIAGSTPNSSQSFELVVAREERNALSQASITTRLNALDPLQLASTLELEPDWVIALILKSHNWPWHNVMLEQIGPERKGRVSRLVFTLPPQRLIESMLNALYARASMVQDHLLLSDDNTPIARPKWATMHRKLHGFVTWAF